MKNLTTRSVLGIATLMALAAAQTPAQQESFNGLHLNLGNLFRLSKAKTRSISPENLTGEKGRGGMATEGTGRNAARELGQKWKVSPSVRPARPRKLRPTRSSRSG